MAISKIILNGVTQMDVTQDTVASSNLLSGYTATKNDGTKVSGSYVPPSAPTGNIDITQAGVTNVTNYATATVAEASIEDGGVSWAFSTVDNQRKCTLTPWAGFNGGYISGYMELYGEIVNAVPKNVTITPSTSAQTIGGSAYMMEGAVTVAAMPTGTAGTPTATKGTVSNHSVSVTPSVTNTTGYITGGTKSGTAVTVSASELVSGTLSITSSGTKDVTNYASASVASGSVGVPTATKGTVSNNSMTVTPSVTYNAGYITGGTSSGTAVTVSASELVSGTKTVTTTGTSDVTNYASVNVDISFSTIYTGSGNPSSSTGTNGDIYLKI